MNSEHMYGLVFVYVPSFVFYFFKYTKATVNIMLSNTHFFSVRLKDLKVFNSFYRLYGSEDVCACAYYYTQMIV